MSVGLRNPEIMPDDTILAFGDQANAPFTLSSAGVAANTALAGVLVGTPVTPIAPAADSLIIANKIASGDIVIAVNKGGNSHMAFMADASTGDTLIQATTGQSVDHYIAGTKVLDHATGAFAFQENTTVSSTGTLTLGAVTLGGVVSGGGQQVNNVIIGTVTPLAGFFTTGSFTGVLNMGAVKNYINDTANTKLTIGLTINQGASDDEIFTLKSSDVNTTSSRTENDTYLNIAKATATTGGAQFMGLNTDSSQGIVLWGFADAIQTTKTTAALGVVDLICSEENGAGGAVPGVDANLATIRAHATARFIFDAEGSGHADVEWIAFDTHNDLVLLDALQSEWTDRLTPARYGANPIYYNRKYLEDVGIVGHGSWHVEDRGGRLQTRSMVNFTKLAMLHHGALLQVGDRLMSLESENTALRNRIEYLESALGGA